MWRVQYSKIFLPAAVAASSSASISLKRTEAEDAKDVKERYRSAPGNRPNLPVFRQAEVAQHNGGSKADVWVTYRDGVYDITEFIANHPGIAHSFVFSLMAC